MKSSDVLALLIARLWLFAFPFSFPRVAAVVQSVEKQKISPPRQSWAGEHIDSERENKGYIRLAHHAVDLQRNLYAVYADVKGLTTTIRGPRFSASARFQ